MSVPSEDTQGSTVGSENFAVASSDSAAVAGDVSDCTTKAASAVSSISGYTVPAYTCTITGLSTATAYTVTLTETVAVGYGGSSTATASSSATTGSS